MPPPLFGAALPPQELFQLLLALVAGGGAVYLLLPRPRPYPSLWGAAAGAIALLVIGAFLVRVTAVNPENVLFYLFSGAALLSGALLVTQHKPARAALSFALVILSVSGLFLLLAAPFLAAASITVYAGAIIVTFLFVIMLAQQAGADDADSRSREPAMAAFTGMLLAGALIYVLQLSYERNYTVIVLDDLIARTRQARATGTDLAHFPYEAELYAPLRAAIDEQEKHANTGDLRDLRARVENRTLDWPAREEDAAARLDLVLAELVRARQQHGFLQATGAPTHVPLSDQSGPPANEPFAQLRYGADGRPQMPHDNSAYLGRSLFTDFLLPVELGGVLLLVATVGAIAIAHRVQPERRP